MDEFQEPQEFLVAMTAIVLRDHRSAGDVEGSEQARGAMPHIVVCHPCRCCRHDRKSGSRRSIACICDFSSTASTRALSGGAMYKPTTSRTLSTNCGSVDSFHVSTACGFNPNARQIRETADCDIPIAEATDRVDQ